MFQGLKNQYCANIGVASSGDVCKVKGFKGAWCLAARGVRQAVWKRVSPGSSEAAPGDNVELETYPLSCGSGSGLNTLHSLSCGS
ncbi:hypothetical protein DEO72_LG7g1799 [Vigna unguiculata]|uniref:Uncharacterized protein n=1 Tax=Vigna unguiculata TaxID=3917 RepID=A0A4D6MJX8_VIGUN|nr:hypothetical protein DEO72_LG7g1799 [Vigna unguiculata]